MAQLVYSYRDAAGLLSGFTVGFDAFANEAAHTTLQNALSIGQLARITSIQSLNIVSKLVASNDQAAVGDGIRIYLIDSVTDKEHFFTLPMPDMADWVMIPGGKGAIDLTTPVAVTDYITSVESHVLSPAGNAVQVDRAVRVGRSR